MTPGRYSLTVIDSEVNDVAQFDCAGVLALAAIRPGAFTVSIRGLDAQQLSIAVATMIDRVNALDPSIMPGVLALVQAGRVPDVVAVRETAPRSQP